LGLGAKLQPPKTLLGIETGHKKVAKEPQHTPQKTYILMNLQ
jgi:hypothetical protein